MIFVRYRNETDYINRSRRMPVLLRNIFLLMFVFSIAMVIPKRSKAQLNVSFQVFYDELSPYGSWMNNADYGYVWCPSNRNNFFPYGNNGYWLYTEMGWSWVSTYRWGWAPFHYGRWFYDSYYGWVWVPGYEWSPAWVAWREAPGYYGWAPLSPGISIDIAFGNNYNLPYDRWRFVNQRDIGRRDIDKHFAGLGGYLKYLEQSRSINNVRQDQSRNISYHAGPQINEVEKVTGQHFNPVKIKSLQTPKQNVTKNELQIFKPAIKSNTKENIKPKKIEVWKNKVPKSGEQQIKPNQEKAAIQPRDIPQQPEEKIQPKKEQPVQNKPVQQVKEIRKKPLEKKSPQQQKKDR